MRVNVLQHTPDEGPGAIRDWAHAKRHTMFVYHPAQFGKLPTAAETDLLVILGGPISPNDDLPWIAAERELIGQLLAAHTPIFGACFGAQQVTKQLGYVVGKSPAKEVGWAPVIRQSNVIPGLPDQLTVLHWHEDMFEIPADAQLLFSSARVRNQGYLYSDNVIGLQFHLEPLADNVREMVVNDGDYIAGSVLGQPAAKILATPVPLENQLVLFQLLNFITEAN
ncbi:type 1 glutamine amidotransferase [Levilactobacillus fujinensis]|uniref:Type 1 glutamine amidotransferase n=1 Tax=Levilactobacillus fujinensis TaxID=2486024 RepID=A0ABW1TK52_9LACO|nr:type 1 glutamine amidotransferase [Levilactobacillus fujinensis]